MQNVIIAKPYRFVPPHRGTFWWHACRPILRPYLRRTAGIAAVECHGTERLRASLEAGHGIILAPNHCRPCDPFVLGTLSCAVNRPFFIVASWHVFMQKRLHAFLLPRLGTFSIYREGTDREAVKTAIRVTAEARRPLVIFPEGVLSRHNDTLNHLMEGTALIARGAAKQRATLPSPGKVVVHPVAIRYFFDGDIAKTAASALLDIERRLTWHAQDQLPIKERMAKVGTALLALKEVEYFGAPQPGTIAARLERLINRLLAPLEAEWVKGRRDEEIVGRVKLLRMAIVPEMVNGNLDESELQRRWRHLADLSLAQQLSSYTSDDLAAEPTPEQLLETIERFEEDMTDRTPVHAPMRAVIDVGEAIEVSSERARGADGDPLMIALREKLETMLAHSLARVAANRPALSSP